MALFDLREPGYTPPRLVIANWDNFRRGLNTLLKDTEIPKDALAQADNIMLIGQGTPTRRWGLGKYFTAGATGSVRGMLGYYLNNGNQELVAVTDQGYLVAKSGASYITRVGASWASGYPISMAQLNDDVYIVSKSRELVRYSTPTLSSFPTVAKPSGVAASQASGATGPARYSYRVNTITSTGETLASPAVELSNQPSDLATGSIKIAWTQVSAASGVLVGYGVFGRNAGDERFISTVYYPETYFIDDGSIIPSEFGFPPLADSTGGVVAGSIERYDDRILYADIPSDPSKMIISGRVPLHERTDVASGGNYLRIEPDAGDPIVKVKGFGSRIIAFKQNSLWDVNLSQITSGNFVITQPSATLITSAHGCIAPRSIAAVEKDIFYLTRKGVYAVGYEPNILADVLRTNEVSATIRPYFESLTISEMEKAIAIYAGFKYILIFPGKNEAMVYDRERMAWVGPWTFDANSATIYYDDANNERYLIGSESSPVVYELSQAYPTDDGNAIKMIIRTRKEDFGDWSLFKTLRDVYTNWENVQGVVSVDLRIEDRNGNTKTIKTFTLNETDLLGETGWGYDIWGTALFGDSNGTGGITAINDLVKWLSINKTVRRIQLIIRTTQTGSNFELLGIQSHVRPIGRGLKGKGWRVTS